MVNLEIRYLYLDSNFRCTAGHNENRPPEEHSTGDTSNNQHRPVSQSGISPDRTPSTLRSRFHPTPSSDSNQCRVQSESERASQGGSIGRPISQENSGGSETRQTGSTSPDDGMINIRLIKPDRSLPISVAANTTLRTLRR